MAEFLHQFWRNQLGMLALASFCQKKLLVELCLVGLYCQSGQLVFVKSEHGGAQEGGQGKVVEGVVDDAQGVQHDHDFQGLEVVFFPSI